MGSGSRRLVSAVRLCALADLQTSSVVLIDPVSESCEALLSAVLFIEELKSESLLGAHVLLDFRSFGEGCVNDSFVLIMLVG